MANQPYDIDPLILQYGQLPTRKRGVDDCFIGQGTPIIFDFLKGQPLNAWTVDQAHGYTVVPQEGYLNVTWDEKNANKNARSFPFISRPFSIINGSVSIAFTFKMNGFIEGGGSSFLFDTGDAGQNNILELLYRPQSSGGSQYFTFKDGTRTLLGPSAIQVGQSYQIVIIVGLGSMKVWENDVLAFTYEGYTPDEFQFGIGTGGGINLPGPDTSVEIGTIKVIVGPSGRIIMKRQDIPNLSTLTNNIINNKKDIQPLVDNCKADIMAFCDQLKNIKISAWDIFWGKNPDDDIIRNLTTLKNSKNFRDLTSKLSTLGDTREPYSFSTFIGAGASASVFYVPVLQFGATVGFQLSSPPLKSYFIVTPFGGVVTNEGISIYGQIGINRGRAKDVLGWGCYSQIDIGEFVFGAFGAESSFPLDWDKCGVYISAGATVSLLPLDYATGLSYAFNIAEL